MVTSKKVTGSLVFFCGKMGAGKSTESSRVSQQRNAVLISEDEWLSSLYPDQILSFDDYIKFSGLLKPLIKTHVQSLLNISTNVVMDFPGNTKKQRKWLNDLASEIGADSELIYLKVDDSLCLKQIEKRSIEQPARAQFDTEQMFLQVTKHFEEPNESEGLKLTIVERK
jgi:predicted kinase